MNFWTQVSRIILKGRYPILVLIAALTYYLASQMQYMRFSYTEANLLPKNHKINLEYNKFLELFGEEGNLIILATDDSTIFSPKKFNAWNELSKNLDSFVEVDFTVAIGDIKKLIKNTKEQKFDVEPLYAKNPETLEEVLKIKTELFDNLPFFDNFLYNKKSETIRTIVFLEKDIVNTADLKRKIILILEFPVCHISVL
jgi:predicted RND superfamily exporter protein